MAKSTIKEKEPVTKAENARVRGKKKKAKHMAKEKK